MACFQWLEPLMGAGFWVPEIVKAARGICVTGEVRWRSVATAGSLVST